MTNETMPIDERLLEDLYSWIDQIPLSRGKKSMARDFSDGVLVAEVVKHYIPSVVELHNYAAANKVENKMKNWQLLNRKVFKKLGFALAEDVLRSISTCRPWAVEQMLMMLRIKIDKHIFEVERENKTLQPESDQRGAAGIPVRSDPSSTHSQQAFDSTGAAAMGRFKNDMVPKVLVEEKEQEILEKEETIQILTAKVRRLEHLVHLKDIRIEDLQGRQEQLEQAMRPTAKISKKSPGKMH